MKNGGNLTKWEKMVTINNSSYSLSNQTRNGMAPFYLGSRTKQKTEPLRSLNQTQNRATPLPKSGMERLRSASLPNQTPPKWSSFT